MPPGIPAYNPQLNAPQPTTDCCDACYSSSLGNSAPQPNPVLVDVGANVIVANVNPARKESILMNVGISPIYIGLGFKPSPPNAAGTDPGAYSFILVGGTAIGDGLGGVWVNDIWQGQIQACGPDSSLSLQSWLQFTEMA